MTDTIRDNLNTLLADYQVLYHKLRNYHWNVTGPHFFVLHAKFEELYNDAALKVDELAERVAALGGKPHSTMRDVLAHARLQEDGAVPDAVSMVRNLVSDLDSLTGHLRETAGMAVEASDTATANLAEEIADAQEKTTWMLRAFIG